MMIKVPRKNSSYTYMKNKQSNQTFIPSVCVDSLRMPWGVFVRELKELSDDIRNP